MSRQADDPPFAHPVERELARLFDAHGVRWLYEPHTFVLERHPDGNVREAFTPDFYLPDFGLYVECTVARQCLTSRKRRKVRKIRAQRGIRVEVLSGRDFARLADRWSLTGLAAAATANATAGVSTAPGAGNARVPMRAPGRRGRAISGLPAVEDFRIDEEWPGPATVVLAIHGEADLRHAGELEDHLGELMATDPETLVLDLTDVPLLDSSALGVLLTALKSQRGRGRQLRVVAPAEIRRIFEVTLLDRVFALDASRDDALRAAADGRPRAEAR